MPLRVITSRKKLILSVSVILLTAIELSCTFGCWYADHFIRPGQQSHFLQSLMLLEWTGQGPQGLHIDIGCPLSRELMDDGWYPSEPAPQVWFRHQACILLPLIPPGRNDLAVRAVPYQPPGAPQHKLSVFWDDDIGEQIPLGTSWNHIRLTPIKPSGVSHAPLCFRTEHAYSPAKHEKSPDNRVISAGIDYVDCATHGYLDASEDQISCLMITDKGAYIRLKPGTGLAFSGHGDESVYFRDIQGNGLVLNKINRLYLADEDRIFDSWQMKRSSRAVFKTVINSIQSETSRLYGNKPGMMIHSVILGLYLTGITCIIWFLYRVQDSALDPSSFEC